MQEQRLLTAAKPVWVSISSKDVDGTKKFYTGLFGWTVQDLGPEAGNYGFFLKDGKMAGGVGPTQGDQAPTAWEVFIGTDDVNATTEKVRAAGGTVVTEPMDVMNVGKVAVYQDTTGAFFCAWQAVTGGTLEVQGEPNTFDWAELTARGMDKAKAFYPAVFGWGVKEGDMGNGTKYTEWQLGDKSVGGGMEMPATVPALVPSYWMPYFATDEIEATFAHAIELGAKGMMEPTPYPGGRFAIISDPQGGTIGLTGK